MQYIPIKTDRLQPPQDDLFSALNKALTSLEEGDIVVISSKVVAIHEGNCLPITDEPKSELVEREAELVIPRTYKRLPLTIRHGAFIGNAGIDVSNANGHYILLPKDPFASAKNIYVHLKEQFNLEKLGVIITDSHSSPLRRGATGISIGFWGFEPIRNYVGKPDLFGRPLKVEVANLVDGIAAGAVVVTGEADEGTPVVIVRGVPAIEYTEENRKGTVIMPFSVDYFRVLYERFLS